MSTFHVLTAEVVFSDDVRARADRVFGGAYGTETSTQLTALLVNSRRRNPERMQGWFRHDGRPLRVVAMEEGRADVIVVRERSEALQRSLEVLGNQALMKVSLSQRARNSGVLRKGDRVRFVMPGWQEGSGGATAADGASNSGSASGSGGGSDSEIMPVDAGKIEVPTLLESITFRWLPGETHLDAQPLAESVAIAGLWAATGNRRTVVVLVRGGDTEDVSRLSPDQVRAYLAALGVPLRVWTLPVGEDRGDPWGDDHDLGNADALVGALAELRYLLEGQFVVWVEGEVPAHRIEITDRARGMKRPR